VAPCLRGAARRPRGPARRGGRVASTQVVASRAVFIDADDAKTDVILAGALAVLGPTLLGFVSRLPLLPRTGVGAVVVELIALALLTLLVPLWSARYRQDGAAAFGVATGGHLQVAGTATRATAALQLAAPVVVLGVLLAALLSSQASVLALGRLGLALRTADPVVSLVLTIAQVAVLSLGTLVLTGFLSVRGRAGFPRSPDVSLTELVRTLGLAAAGIALLTGLVRIAGGADVRIVALNVLALVTVLLLADRLVPVGLEVPRTTVAAPLVVIVADADLRGRRAVRRRAAGRPAPWRARRRGGGDRSPRSPRPGGGRGGGAPGGGGALVADLPVPAARRRRAVLSAWRAPTR
jgi:uncharacterized membrane protein YgcG